MALLWQKDVPLIITILVAAWTWIASEHIKQTDALQILEYQYNYDGQNNKILFRNISQSKSIKSIRVLVSCPARPYCFKSQQGFAGTTGFVPPFGVIPSEPGKGDDSQAYFTFSLTVDAAIILMLYADKSTELRFSIVNSDQYDNLTLLERNSLTACFYRNHQWVILLILIVATAAILFFAHKSMNANKPAESLPTRHSVDLTINRKPPVSGQQS